VLTCDKNIGKAKTDRLGQDVSGLRFRPIFIHEAANKVAENEAGPDRM
jgi:hypothetical protein